MSASQSAQEILAILAKIAHLDDETRDAAYHKAASTKKGIDGRDLPIVAVAVYRNDVLTIRQGQGLVSINPNHNPRGAITEMSDDSLRRLAFLANNADCEFRSMVTLTYPNEFPSDGAIVKDHLQNMLRSFKRRIGDPLTYVWFLEFQRRGAPHIHILLQVGLTHEEAPTLRSWLSERWFKIVGSGDDLHRLAGTRWENTRQAEGLRRYVTKYAFKTFQKEVPEGFQRCGRFWGASRNVKLEPILIELSDEEKVRGCLVEWPHNDVLESKIPRVLYNAATYWGLTA